MPVPLVSGLQVRLWAALPGKPDIVHYANGGIGDELMLTAITREARRQGRPIHVITAYPQLWRHNADPASLQLDVDRWWYAHRRGWIGTRIQHLTYDTRRERHIAAQMADYTGVELPSGWRPVLTVDRPARQANLIVAQNSCRGARFSSPTKEWPQARWEQLMPHLTATHRVVQLGTKADPVLPGAEDFRGATDLPAAARIIGSAALFLGLESGLQHMAAAVGTPAVIIYGGRSRPAQTGYAFNVNLTRSPECAGCVLDRDCPHHMVCMEIPVEEVLAGVQAALANPP
jgi:ADP-heptose:LPS heptosyltransferase